MGLFLIHCRMNEIRAMSPKSCRAALKIQRTTRVFSGVYPRAGLMRSSDGARGLHRRLATGARSNGIPVTSHLPVAIRDLMSSMSKVHTAWRRRAEEIRLVARLGLARFFLLAASHIGMCALR